MTQTSKTVQFAAIIDGVTKKKDGTLSLKIGTQELGAQDTAEIFRLGNQEVWLALKEAPLAESDIEMPEFIPEFKGQKSFSQRLRGVLYRVWEQKTDHSKTERQFYEDYMSKLIDNLKEKLD